MIEKRQSPDRQHRLTKLDAARKHILENVPGGFSSDGGRAAAVHLLLAKKLVRDEGALQDLLNCSQRQIEAAKARAAAAIRDNDGLGKVITTLLVGLVEPQDQKAPEATSETLAENLMRTARIKFKVDEPGIQRNERNKRERMCTLAVVYMYRWALKKTPQEIAQTLKRSLETVSIYLKNAREEYDGKHTFYHNVEAIRRELKI